MQSPVLTETPAVTPAPASVSSVPPVLAAVRAALASSAEASTPRPHRLQPSIDVERHAADGSIAVAVDVAPPVTAVDLNAIREVVTSALENEGHHTAAALLSAGNWTDAGNAIQVEVAVKKTMLGLTMNAEAEKIIRNALRAAGFNQKFNVHFQRNRSQDAA